MSGGDISRRHTAAVSAREPQAAVTTAAGVVPDATKDGYAAKAAAGAPRRSNDLLAARLASRREAAGAGTSAAPVEPVRIDLAGIAAASIASAALDVATAAVEPPPVSRVAAANAARAPMFTPQSTDSPPYDDVTSELEDQPLSTQSLASSADASRARPVTVTTPSTSRASAMAAEMEELRRELIAAGQVPAPFTAAPTAADIRALQSALATRYAQPQPQSTGASQSPSAAPRRPTPATSDARPLATGATTASPAFDRPVPARDPGRAAVDRQLYSAEDPVAGTDVASTKKDLSAEIDAFMRSQPDIAPAQRPPHRAPPVRPIASQPFEADDADEDTFARASTSDRSRTSPVVYVGIVALVALLGAGAAYIVLGSRGGGSIAPTSEQVAARSPEQADRDTYRVTMATRQATTQPADAPPVVQSSSVPTAATVLPKASTPTEPLGARSAPQTAPPVATSTSVSPPSAVAATAPSSSSEPAAATPVSPASRPSGDDVRQIKRNLDSAAARVAVGDIASARMFYQRAAELGDARGAVALAETFDPNALARLGVRGLQADPAKARRWYQTAIDLGATEAKAPLARLPTR